MGNNSNIAGGGIRGPAAALPPGVADMLLGGSRPESDGAILNEGQPPLHPNEVQFEANANEVIMVCHMTTGEGSAERPFKRQEVARLVFSWHAMEVLIAMGNQLLMEGLDSREATLTQTLAAIQMAKEQRDQHRATQAQTPPPTAD